LPLIVTSDWDQGNFGQTLAVLRYAEVKSKRTVRQKVIEKANQINRTGKYKTGITG